MVDINKRAFDFDFGLGIIHLVNSLPKTTAGYAIGNQIIRSGTSIGANIEEAMGGHTKSDFTYCMNVAKKEARETKYWLKILTGARLGSQERVESLLKESDELVAILTTIVRKASSKN